MFIPYAQNDILSGPKDKHWFADRLVGCHYERSGISYSVRKAVLQFGDNYKVQSEPGDSPISKIIELAPVKHHVPYNRICKALYTNMMNRGTEKGEGMTREQSLKYLRWILDNLGLRPVQGGPSFDTTQFEPPVPKKSGMREQFHSDDAVTSRKDYEQWVSWAVGLICDWPENLFCGLSSGDDKGQKTDWPRNQATADRVREAAEKLRYYIYDLAIGPYRPYDTDSMDIPACNRAWNISVKQGKTYKPDKNGEEWWLPCTYEEQLKWRRENQVPRGSDIIENSQDLPIDFTGS